MVPCLKLQNITHSANGILLERKKKKDKNGFSLSNSFHIKPTLVKLKPLSSAVPATGGLFFPHSTFHSTRFVFVHPQFSQPFLIAFPPPVPTTAPAAMDDQLAGTYMFRTGPTPCTHRVEVTLHAFSDFGI